jgi:hypothetical protein
MDAQASLLSASCGGVDSGGPGEDGGTAMNIFEVFYSYDHFAFVKASSMDEVMKAFPKEKGWNVVQVIAVSLAKAKRDFR